MQKSYASLLKERQMSDDVGILVLIKKLPPKNICFITSCKASFRRLLYDIETF